MELSEKDLVRFWSKVDKTSSPNGCWLWTAGKHQEYGVFSVGYKNFRTHRVAWVIVNGPIPDGLFVCHDCPGGADNRTCCNPSHCFLGTAADNAVDAKNKGTLSCGDRHYSHTSPEKLARGEKCHTAKLTERDVLKIRETPVLKRGDIAIAARRLGVRGEIVGRIIRGETWKHLLPAQADTVTSA